VSQTFHPEEASLAAEFSGQSAMRSTNGSWSLWHLARGSRTLPVAASIAYTRPGDQPHDRFVVAQRFRAPVRRDEREQAVLDLDNDLLLIRQRLQGSRDCTDRRGCAEFFWDKYVAYVADAFFQLGSNPKGREAAPLAITRPAPP